MKVFLWVRERYGPEVFVVTARDTIDAVALVRARLAKENDPHQFFELQELGESGMGISNVYLPGLPLSGRS